MKYSMILVAGFASASLAGPVNSNKKQFLQPAGRDCEYFDDAGEDCHGTAWWCNNAGYRERDGYKSAKECWDDHEDMPAAATDKATVQALRNVCFAQFGLTNKYNVSMKDCNTRLDECLQEEQSKGGNKVVPKPVIDCLDKHFERA